MSSREQIVREYYGVPSDCFWQWLDDGDAVGWRDGKLITFDQELTFVLNQMSPSGLPRLGAVLLLLAATRKNWAVDGSEAGLLTGMISASESNEDDPKPSESQQHNKSSQGSGNENTNQIGLTLLQRVLNGLHKIRSLDGSLRNSLEAKAALASIVFEDVVPVVCSKDATFVANAIRPGLLSMISSQENEVSSGLGPFLLLKDLAILASGLEKVTPEVVRLRLETGLDELPTSAFLEEEADVLSPSDSARALIQKLMNSPEYAGVAMLAKQLLSCTTLPRKLLGSQEQEMGGYSDIANRGTPDRLLLSELAQDGLTLAVRVAMNEAMYLHRETPPSAPKMRRELLIDSGVHAWGLPRAFVASVALAFAANTPEGAAFGAWRGSGATLKEVHLSSHEGFVDHLSALEPDPHLGEALYGFSSILNDSVDPVEAILLMPSDAYDEPAFKEKLRDLIAVRVFIATVNREGEFRLTERGPRGEKLLRSAKLPIEKLFSGDTQPIETRDINTLPAIFRATPFPLLMPPLQPPGSSDSRSNWPIGSTEALSITSDGRLLHWTNPRKGAQQLCDHLPKGKLWWASPECIEGVTRFVYGTSQKLVHYRLDITCGHIDSTPLKCNAASEVISHNGVLFCLQGSGVTEVNSQTGVAVAVLAMPSDLRFRGGRYFQKNSANEWYALSHDGHSASIELMPLFATLQDPVVYVWDAIGFSEPLALTKSGKLLSSSEDRDKLPQLRPKMHNCRVVEASHDGKRLLVQDHHLGNNQLYEIILNLRPQFSVARYPKVDYRIAAIVRSVSVRKRFKSIGITEEGALALRSNKSIVTLDIKMGMPVFSQCSKDKRMCFEQKFEEAKFPNDCRFQLLVAEWDSGDKAFLDSRGLLHLKPVDTEIPETTFVLAEGEMTGWNSKGKFFGREYFMPESEVPVQRRGTLMRELHRESVGQFMESLRASN